MPSKKEIIELKTSIQQMLKLLTKHIAEFKEFKADTTRNIKDIKDDIKLMKNTPTMQKELDNKTIELKWIVFYLFQEFII